MDKYISKINVGSTDYKVKDGDARSILSSKADKVSGATNNHVATLDSDGNLKDGGYTIDKSVPSNAVFTDTTYLSKAAVSGGTDVSLVTTGEKATWNAKTSNTGTVTKVTAGTGLTGGDITTTGTIALDTSGVTAGTYKSVTVDSYGRVTGGSNPTDQNTTYKFTIGTTTKGDSTNGVDLGTLKSETAAANGTTLSLVTTGEKNTWNSKQNAITFNTAYNASSNKAATMSDIPTIPTSLKNPNAIKVNTGSTDVLTYDGSAAKTLTITGGTNKFTISDGTTSKDVTVTPSISNNVTGSGLTADKVVIGNGNSAVKTSSKAITGTTPSSSSDDTTIPTSKAVWSAISNGIAANDAMVYKGTIAGGSTGAYGALTAAADKGWTYKVTTAGKIDGVAVEIGDIILCNTDSTAAATSSNYSTIAANWDFIQSNIDGAVTGPASSTDAHIATFNGSTGKVIKDSGYTIAKSVPSNAVFTDTNTKVTAVGNHYAPTADSNSALTANATGATAAWSIDVVKGLTISRDAKGHVTGVTVTSGKIPANPNTDTKVTAVANHYTPSANANSELTASLSGTAAAYALNTEYTVLTGVKAQRDAAGHVTGLTYTAQKIKDTNTNTTYTAGQGLVLNSTTFKLGSGTIAHYSRTASGAAYIKININSTVKWMMSFHVRLYGNYVCDDYIISGYQNASSYWHAPTAILQNSDGTTRKVIFGYDSANNLWVAIPDRSYTGCDIIDVVNGYNPVSSFDGLFTLTRVAEADLATKQTEVTVYPAAKTSQLLSIGTTATTAAAGNHTHTASLATDTGTSAITLAYGGKYKLTAGGNSVIFTMPASDNTNTTYSAGTGLSLSGTTFNLALTKALVTSALGYTPPTTNTTYNFSGTSFTSNNSTGLDANNVTYNAHTYYTSNGPTTTLGASTNDGGLYSQAYSTSWVGQIAQDYRNGNLFTRGKNNGTWQDWRKVMYTGDALTKAQVTDALGYTPPTSDTNTTYSAGTGLSLSGTTFSLATSGVTAGTYKRVTVDAYGRVTAGDQTDANTDVNVTQTATNTNANYEVLFSATADNTTRTEGARKYSNLTFNPSTGNLSVTKINGVAVGTSPKFTDNNTTYSAGTGLSLSGTTFSLATSGVTAGTYKRVTVDAYGRVTSGDLTDANTDTLVTQTATSTNANYEVLFSGTADNTTRTEGARKNIGLTFNPSSGNLSIVGSLNLANDGTCKQVITSNNGAIAVSCEPGDGQSLLQSQWRTIGGTNRLVTSIYSRNSVANKTGCGLMVTCVDGGSSGSGTVGICTGSSFVWDDNAKLYVEGASKATAWNTTSDIRMKDVVENKTLTVDEIAEAPSFIFTWKNGRFDKNSHLGTSAQYWKEVVPEAVSEASDEEKTLSMEYDKIALVSCISMAKEIKALKEEILSLKDEISELKSNS